ILVVISVIVAMAAISFPAFTALRARGQVQQTRTLLGALATAVAKDGRPGITCSDDKVRRPWDLDENNEVDGDPGHAQAPALLTSRAPSGYRGLVADTGTNLRQNQLNERLQPIDAWGRPIRITWLPGGFGAADFGLWSAGPDGIDAPNDPGSDDIRSWEAAQ
nr:hypothetical protein [Planctomycetota bacterium]